MICKRCGFQFNEAKFCPECGFPVAEKSDYINPDDRLDAENISSVNKEDISYMAKSPASGSAPKPFDVKQDISDSAINNREQHRDYGDNFGTEDQDGNTQQISTEQTQPVNYNSNSANRQYPTVQSYSDGYQSSNQNRKPQYSGGNRGKNNNNNAKKKKNPNTPLMVVIIIAIVVIVAAICIFAFSAFNKNGSTAPTGTTSASQNATQEATTEVVTEIVTEYVTQPPATQPPATEPPATDPPATEPPATEPPATEPPATEAPQSSAASTAQNDLIE